MKMEAAGSCESFETTYNKSDMDRMKHQNSFSNANHILVM
jgi:hypothetical protein